nr:ARID DNA-binding domain-containing protein [Tanacetum cinerariifolium]
MLVIKIFSEKKKVFRERKKCAKIRAKRENAETDNAKFVIKGVNHLTNPEADEILNNIEKWSSDMLTKAFKLWKQIVHLLSETLGGWRDLIIIDFFQYINTEVEKTTMISMTVNDTKVQGFKASKSTELITYPETIHFSTTCMIKDTDLTNWDKIWYISDQIDRHVCYKLDNFYNIKEGFSVTKLENQKKFLFTYGLGEVLIEESGKSIMIPDKEVHTFDEDRMKKMHNKYLQDYFESLSKENEGKDLIKIKGNLYSTKVQTFNDYVTFLNLVKNDEIKSQEWEFFRNKFNKVVKWFYIHYLGKALPGPIPPTIDGTEIHLFDLYKLIEGMGRYISVNFCQEFDIIGEILGLSRKNGGKVKDCYMKYLDIFISYFKTARAPQKEYIGDYNHDISKPIKEEDRDCLLSQSWNVGGTGARTTKNAVQKNKGKVERFGVKLEDTKDDAQEQPIFSHYAKGDSIQRTYAGPSKIHEEGGSSTNAPTIPVFVEENLGDPIDIRVDIIHPEPIAAVAFPAVAVEELTALRFRVDIDEAENASLHARIKTTKAIEKITRNRERQVRTKMDQQLATVQELQQQDRENFRKLQELVTSQLGRHL